MYFFLANLSFVDICSTSTTIPEMLVNMQTQSKAITYAGCITQMYFLLLFSGLDSFLLTVMAYDQYVAICHPLHYIVIMNHRICRLLCQLKQVVHLPCSDIFLNYMMTYMTALLLGVGSIHLHPYTYSNIVSSIHAILSTEGRYKAFSTCASHLSVVSLFHCTVVVIYLSSSVTQNSPSTATVSLMYTVVTPMMKPFIYSLRNKDIKSVHRRLFGSTPGKESVDPPQ
ncbi:Olfactory receptor 7A10 [Sciurus carolinensis]|uniref:Olfactory receptor 7A10 n=1 Tax=Sciurus carolinensis TaxID=30640 RepID=A0AA41T4Y0_SCICA|nr:Olfactory receptor 7A10 [Sciurus carolinensis]